MQEPIIWRIKEYAIENGSVILTRNVCLPLYPHNSQAAFEHLTVLIKSRLQSGSITRADIFKNDKYYGTFILVSNGEMELLRRRNPPLGG